MIDWPGIWIATALSLPAGVAATYAYQYLEKEWQKRQNAITIDLPKAGEMLQNPQVFYGRTYYPVTLRLGFIPPDHEIWLLTSRVGENKVWPQGADKSRVQKGGVPGTYTGFFHAVSGGPLTVTAVVAPPTSQMLFNYYERYGGATGWAQLDNIPPECMKTKASVTAMVP